MGRLKEFKYSSENYHRVISIISWILDFNGYHKTNNKVLKRGEYHITHDGAELVVKRQTHKGHWKFKESNDHRYYIRHGDNGKYSCFIKYDDEDWWHHEFHVTKGGKPWYVEARSYQYMINGDIDDNDKGINAIMSSIRGFLNIKKKKAA